MEKLLVAVTHSRTNDTTSFLKPLAQMLFYRNTLLHTLSSLKLAFTTTVLSVVGRWSSFGLRALLKGTSAGADLPHPDL